MAMSNYKYRFSPSLLDKFQKYLDSEIEFESDFNYSEETGYKASLGEIVAAREQELMDALNYVEPTLPIFAAARGTALNDCVDFCIDASHGIINVGPCEHGKTYIQHVGDTIKCLCDGIPFEFDCKLVEDLAKEVENGTMQLHVSAVLPTEHGDVLLHGFPDYIQPCQITDLKSTENYTWGKYEHYWQRYAYPYIMQSAGLMERVVAFEFLVAELKTDRKTNVILGSIYKETYTDVNVDKCRSELQWICNGLAMFVEDHRSQITNTKIFGTNEQ